MVDSDSILAGFTAAVFAFVGLNVVVCCLRRRRAAPKMKHSSSTEELTKMENDPQLV
jgi:hypothetical protein